MATSIEGHIYLRPEDKGFAYQFADYAEGSETTGWAADERNALTWAQTWWGVTDPGELPPVYVLHQIEPRYYLG